MANEYDVLISKIHILDKDTLYLLIRIDASIDQKNP